MKILIAEDDATSRKLLSTVLSKYGDCDLAADGLEAIKAYISAVKEKKHYDLICLDIMMPKVDGIKVLKAIRELESNHRSNLSGNRSKIVITTALTDSQLIESLYTIGCDDFIPKPIDLRRLMENIQR